MTSQKRLDSLKSGVVLKRRKGWGGCQEANQASPLWLLRVWGKACEWVWVTEGLLHGHSGERTKGHEGDFCFGATATLWNFAKTIGAVVTSYGPGMAHIFLITRRLEKRETWLRVASVWNLWQHNTGGKAISAWMVINHYLFYFAMRLWGMLLRNNFQSWGH